MSRLKEFAVIVLISGLIGSIVGLSVILITRADLFQNLLKSFSVGGVIGIVARLFFSLFYRNIRRNTFGAFCSIFIVIGLGTSAGAFFCGVRDTIHIVIMICLAESIGMIAAFIIYRKTIQLNTRLSIVQEKFKQ